MFAHLIRPCAVFKWRCSGCQSVLRDVSDCASVTVFPLYAALAQNQQMKAFQSAPSVRLYSMVMFEGVGHFYIIFHLFVATQNVTGQ